MPEYFLVSRNAGEKWLRLAKARDVGNRSARDAASPNSRSARGVELREPFYSKTEPSRTGQRANGSDQSDREGYHVATNSGESSVHCEAYSVAANPADSNPA